MMTRRRSKGFKLGRKIIKIFKRVTRNSCKYKTLGVSSMQRSKAISKLYQWVRKIKQELLNPGSTRAYVRVGYESVMDTKPGRVPKGHVGVYVGESDTDTRRVVVPVMFLNHPLFEKLLKEAENVYGFNYSGRITIPCPLSEFEDVKTRIAATGSKCQRTVSTYVPIFKCLSI